MSNTDIIARNLAAAFLSGTWTLNGLVRRAALALGEKARWHRRLVRKVMASFAQPPNDRALERIVALIKLDQGFHVAGCRRLHRLFWVTPTMSPRSVVAGSWSVPSLTTPTALMEWLGLKPRELDWFAGCRGEEAEVKSGPLRHYSYRWLPKRSGKWRLLEMPKTRLKAIQGRVLHEILNRIPPHDSAHGFRRGRSIATFVAPHCGRRVVMRFDLRHFFPSVRSSRIRAVFAEAGYPREVARLLTGLCTNTVPDDVWDSCPRTERGPKEWNERQRFRVAHLPQGAPTSPALANLCAYRLDCRLQSLAKSMGSEYTRYADDLAFSGGRELERSLRRFRIQVCTIALEQGFEIHLRKSRYMRQGTRQHLTGVVVNVHPNIRRDEFDLLKAILHNCAKNGPASQNRDGHDDFRSHLLGRIAHITMLNASRGLRLRAIFERIRWQPSEKG